MVDVPAARKAGAPLRMFLVFTACWILGRIVWSLSAPVLVPALAGPVLVLEQTKATPTPIQTAAVDVRGSDTDAFVASEEGLRVQNPITIQIPSASVRQLRIPITGSSNMPDLPSISPRQLPRKGSQIAFGSDAGADTPLSEPVRQFAAPSMREPAVRQSKLSGYAWILARQRSGPSPSTAPIRPGGLSGAQYGASQAGLQIAYRLLGDRDRQIAATARVSGALESSGEEELAIGARIKPITRIPVALHAEQRLNLKSAAFRGTAIYLAGGTGPHALPAGLTAESWGQGGYLFGDRETWFYDGSVSVRKLVARPFSGTLAVGGSIWTGGQKGATRVDTGPRASLVTPLGGGHARLDIDWRQRVAGNARPGSGLTLTVSTGF